MSTVAEVADPLGFLVCLQAHRLARARVAKDPPALSTMMPALESVEHALAALVHARPCILVLGPFLSRRPKNAVRKNNNFDQ